MQKPIRTLTSLTTAVGLSAFFSAEAAAQAVVGATGGALLQIETRSKAGLGTTGSDQFVNLPGAQVKITIPPAGRSRLVVARFSAESFCRGETPGANLCLLRVVALDAATGKATELHPQSPTGFVFDSAEPPTAAGARSIQRSIRLNPGNYSMRIQWAVSGVGINFGLDGWHLTVEQYD